MEGHKHTTPQPFSCLPPLNLKDIHVDIEFLPGGHQYKIEGLYDARKEHTVTSPETNVVGK